MSDGPRSAKSSDGTKLDASADPFEPPWASTLQQRFPVAPLEAQAAPAEMMRGFVRVGGGVQAPRGAVNGKVHVDPVRFRCSLCASYETGGAPGGGDGCCRFGDRCMFAHGAEQLRTSDDNVADGLTTLADVRAWQKNAAMRAKKARKNAAARRNARARADARGDKAATTKTAATEVSCDSDGGGQSPSAKAKPPLPSGFHGATLSPLPPGLAHSLDVSTPAAATVPPTSGSAIPSGRRSAASSYRHDPYSSPTSPFHHPISQQQPPPRAQSGTAAAAGGGSGRTSASLAAVSGGRASAAGRPQFTTTPTPVTPQPIPAESSFHDAALAQPSHASDQGLYTPTTPMAAASHGPPHIHADADDFPRHGAQSAASGGGGVGMGAIGGASIPHGDSSTSLHPGTSFSYHHHHPPEQQQHDHGHVSSHGGFNSPGGSLAAAGPSALCGSLDGAVGHGSPATADPCGLLPTAAEVTAAAGTDTLAV